jgi:hypothetical protein
MPALQAGYQLRAAAKRSRIDCRIGGCIMMVVVFAALLAAMVLALRGRQRLALAAIAVCLILAIALFLYEIYSPQYGFRMPWLQTQLVPQKTIQAGNLQP